MHEIDSALRAIAARHGVFLRREALELGIDDRTLRHGTRTGRWVRVRHGAYIAADVWAGLDAEGKHRLLLCALARSMGDRIAASHHSGSIVHGLDLWGVNLDVAHVTRLDGGAGRTDRDAVHHEGFCVEDDVTVVDGLQVLRPVRCALESAGLSGVERGLAVVDSGLRRRLFTPAELTAQHALMQSWPGTQHLTLVTRLADGRSESVGESRTRHLLWSQGVPMPKLQFEVYDGAVLVGVTDFAWPEHGLLGEFDGRVKYGRLLRPGEEPGDVVFREKQREDAIRRITGWRFVRLTWDDLRFPGRTAAMIRSMLVSAAA